MHVVYTLADPGKPHGVAFLQRGPFIEVQQWVREYVGGLMMVPDLVGPFATDGGSSARYNPLGYGPVVWRLEANQKRNTSSNVVTKTQHIF